MSQGKLRHTDRPLDLAIDGEGFFQLEDRRTKQIFYTRCGRFAVNAQGELIWRTCATRTARAARGQYSPDRTRRRDCRGWHSPGLHPVGDAATRSAVAQQIRDRPLAGNGRPVPDWREISSQFRGELPLGGASDSDRLSGRVRQGCLEESNVDVDRELHELERLRRQAHAIELAAQSSGVHSAWPVQSSERPDHDSQPLCRRARTRSPLIAGTWRSPSPGDPGFAIGGTRHLECCDGDSLGAAARRFDVEPAVCAIQPRATRRGRDRFRAGVGRHPAGAGQGSPHRQPVCHPADADFSSTPKGGFSKSATASSLRNCSRPTCTSWSTPALGTNSRKSAT